MRCPVAIALTLCLRASTPPASAAPIHHPARATAPAIVALPARFVLDGAGAAQPLLVERRQGDRFVADLTKRATYRSSNPRIAAVTRDGMVRAVGDGSARITASAGADRCVAEVTVRRGR